MYRAHSERRRAEHSQHPGQGSCFPHFLHFDTAFHLDCKKLRRIDRSAAQHENQKPKDADICVFCFGRVLTNPTEVV
jgi:hypothetical protein